MGSQVAVHVAHCLVRGAGAVVPPRFFFPHKPFTLDCKITTGTHGISPNYVHTFTRSSW